MLDYYDFEWFEFPEKTTLWCDEDFYFMVNYVPEAEFLSGPQIIELAIKRDFDAAQNLAYDFEN